MASNSEATVVGGDADKKPQAPPKSGEGLPSKKKPLTLVIQSEVEMFLRKSERATANAEQQTETQSAKKKGRALDDSTRSKCNDQYQ